MKTYRVEIEIQLKEFAGGWRAPTDWIEVALEDQLEAGEWVAINNVQEITA